MTLAATLATAAFTQATAVMGPAPAARDAGPGDSRSAVKAMPASDDSGVRLPGGHASDAPLSEYIEAMASRVAKMDPIVASRPGKITVYVPSAAALVAAYHHDLSSREGHRSLQQQRMMTAAAVARMRQSGAFTQVDVLEYDDSKSHGAIDGLVVAPRPWQLSYVVGGERIASFNPATQWDHYMSRPASSYEDRMSAAADSANMFALSHGK